MAFGTLALRGSIGTFFVGHGAQKLFGSFGGHGLEGTAGFFESLGLRPGRRHALAAGAAEAGGGALLLLGALTPLATTALSATMISAIRRVHLQNGPWVSNGGYEYNAVLVAALTALAQTGPGRPSVDAARFPHLRGTRWAAASLLAAAAASYLVDRTAEQAVTPAAEDLPGDPATSEPPLVQPERDDAGHFSQAAERAATA